MLNQKSINRATYLQALALFVIGAKKQKEASQMEEEMNDLLGEENGSHFSDAMYASEEVTEKTFKLAMLRANIVLNEKPAQPQKAS